MEKVTRFEDLWIWQQARELVKQINEDFVYGNRLKNWVFLDQIQRAGISIMNNIAEGFERSTDVEFSRFLDIAKGSSGEVRSMYYVAEDLGFISPAIAEERRFKTCQISAGIAALTAHLRGTTRTTRKADPKKSLAPLSS